MAKRVQMTRSKGGWRKDNPDAVVVARKGGGRHWDPINCRYGNPFRVLEDTQAGRREAVDLFEVWLRKCGPAMISMVAADLRGKDLACWCPLDQPCHADVLMRIANK